MEPGLRSILGDLRQVSLFRGYLLARVLLEHEVLAGNGIIELAVLLPCGPHPVCGRWPMRRDYSTRNSRSWSMCDDAATVYPAAEAEDSLS